LKRDELRGSYKEGEENWMGMKERSRRLKKEDVGMRRRKSHEIGDGEFIMKKIQNFLSFCVLQLIRKRVGE